MPKTNEAGQKLIQSFESCRLTAYPDPGTGGEPWTIGWGHTGPEIHEGVTITQAQADALFEQDLGRFEACVNDAVSRNATPNQFAAMVSLAYNIGCGAFQGSSVLRDFNAGDLDAAKAAFGMWVNGPNGPMEGLMRRRAAEAELFSTP